jgi:3-oxoacyl-(acyl-carrier-protein) synthase
MSAPHSSESSAAPSGTRRVAISGLGAVSPYGWGVRALELGLESGRAAIGAIRAFDAAAHRTQLAGEVPAPALDPLPELRPRERARLTRSELYALAAAYEAWHAAGLAQLPHPRRVGVFFGSTTGGMYEGEHFVRELRAGRAPRAGSSRLGAQQNNAPGDAIARALALCGPVETDSAACAAASMSLGAALAAVRSGEVELALAGGADALCQLTYAGFNALRAVDDSAARPFRADRGGLSIGEGAGVLVLESFEHARARGRAIELELAGAGASCDAHHMTAPEPEGAGAARALRAALADAGLEPAAIDFVNAHGTGTPHNDAAEGRALHAVFGARTARLPLTSTKGAVGHLLGACGALEAVATALCLRAQRVHATPGAGPADPEIGIDLVLGEPRALAAAHAAISLNLAFGGANAALVLRRVHAAAEGRRA